MEKINDLTKNLKSFKQRATHQLISFNRWEKREMILSKIEGGTHVLVKNYAFDSITDLLASGEKLDNCLFCDKGLPRPDIIFQLDADVEILTKRKNLSGSIEFYQKKQEAYKEFYDKLYWKTINVNRDISEVSKYIIDDINSLLKEYKENLKIDEMKKNFYPNTVGEDLFLENSI